MARQAVILSALLAAAANADTVTVVVECPPADVILSREGGYDRVDLREGAGLGGVPGRPALPSRSVFLLLPPDAAVTGVRVQGDEAVFRRGVRVLPIQPDHPPDRPTPPFVGPDPAIYAVPGPYPAGAADLAGVYSLRGKRVAAVRVYPVRWRPAAGELLLAARMTVSVDYERAPAAMAAAGTPAAVYPASRRFDAVVAGLVANPPAAARIAEAEPAPTAGAVDYLLITAEACTNAFQVLLDHRRSAAGGGYSAAMVTTEWIAANVPGIDIQEQIRCCIRSFVADSNTAYVCLGGSSGLVPDRDCYVTAEGYTEAAMPTDLYYSDLDGTWNADGDGRYGEAQDDASQMDMMPDVVVGRIVIDTAWQASNYVQKLIGYETNRAACDASFGRSLLLSGVTLWNSYSGSARPTDLCDDGHAEFTNRTGSVSDAEIDSRRMYRDDIRPAWESLRLRYLFDTLTSYDAGEPGSHPATGGNLRDAINAEPGLAYFWTWTHGGPTTWSLEGSTFGTANAGELTRLTVFTLTGACDTGRFDTHDSLSEAMIRNPAGGAIHYIGSSRLGWSASSPAYARKYWDAVFRHGMRIGGDAFALHKAAMVPACSANGPPRWLQFGINLQGDPCVPVIGHYPKLAVRNLAADDSAGNGDGIVNPGETIELALTIENAGFAEAPGVEVVLSATNAYLTVLDDRAAFGAVAPATNRVGSDPFRILVTNACPTPADIPVTLTITDATGRAWTNAWRLGVYDSAAVSGSVSAVTGGLPVEGAVVEWDGLLGGQTLSDSNGLYRFVAVNGEHRVRARKAGWAVAPPQSIAPPPGGRLDFQLGAPAIGLEPVPLAVSVPKCGTNVCTLTVTNAGDARLAATLLVGDTAFDSGTDTNLVYWWTDISTNGTRLTALEGEDTISGAIPLGFSFPFYGRTFSNLYASCNGWVSFTPPSLAAPINLNLPFFDAYTNLVAFFWDDLDFSRGGRAWYRTVDADTFILTFQDVPQGWPAPTGATVTAQLVLKSDGSILCQYRHVGDPASATVGFQDGSGVRGYAASFNGTGIPLTGNLTIRLCPGYGTNWVNSALSSFAVPPGGSLPVPLVGNAAGLVPGAYTTAVAVTADDLAVPLAPVPLVMTVLPNPTNRAPTAADGTVTLLEDTSIPGSNAVLNVADADGDLLRLIVVTPPAYGRLRNDRGGTALSVTNVWYSPFWGYHGPDSFAYKVNDYETDSNVATVHVTVISVPDPPTVWLNNPPDEAEVASGQIVSFAAGVYDADGMDNVLWVEFWTTNGMPIGTNAYDGDTAYYVEQSLPQGAYGWYAIVRDADGLAATTGIRTITFDTPPVVGPQRVSTPERTPVQIVLAYTDPDGPGPYTALILVPPSHGVLTGSGTNWTYTPSDEFFYGTDAFAFRLHDGLLYSDWAPVYLDIGMPTGTNFAPYAESFEGFYPGACLIGRRGWYGPSTNAAVLSRDTNVLFWLANDYTSGYPIATGHAQVVHFLDAATNRIDTSNLAGTNLVLDFLYLPERWSNLWPPDAGDTDHFVFYFDYENGRPVVWLRPSPGAPPEWRVLTNGPVVATNRWVRVTVTERFDSTQNVFRVQFDNGPPVTDDAVGFTNEYDATRCWFLMADQSRRHIAEFRLAGEGWLDDLTVDLWTTNAFLKWLATQYPGSNDYGGLATRDTDGDGHNSRQEWIAGTDPNDGASVLAVTGLAAPGSDRVVLDWRSAAGRWYAIDATTNLTAGFSAVVTSGLPATPAVNRYTVTVDSAANMYYRVRVE